MGYFSHQSGHLNSPETETNPHIVTGATEETIQYPHMMTATQEEIPYCSPTTSSGKQKKARSTSQPHFRSENNPTTVEADQILLALQQLATNSNSVNFNINLSRISKVPKSLRTTMPTFDGKSEKFELFEDLFQTSLKNLNQLTEEDKINYFHSLMRGDALQTFQINITSPNRENLGEIVIVFRRKYVKPQSMATAKHKFQRLVFNPLNQILIDFLDELHKLAKDAFGVAAQAIIEQFIYAKRTPHLKKSINLVHLENGTYERIVSHLERELELNSLEAPDELQKNTVTQQASQQNSEKSKPTCHNCNKPSHYRNQCRQLNREKDQTRNNTNSANKNNGSAQTNSNHNNKVANSTKANSIDNQRDRRSRPVFPPCETCSRTNPSTEKCYLGANAANRPPPQNRRPEGQNQVQQRNAQRSSDGNVQAAAQISTMPRLDSMPRLAMPRLHSGAASDRPETNEIPKLPPIPEVVWQQPTEIVTNQDTLNITHFDLILRTNVASQTSPAKGTQPQNHVVAMEQPSRNQTGNEPVPFLDCPKNSSTNTQITEQHVVTTPNGLTTTPLLTLCNPTN